MLSKYGKVERRQQEGMDEGVVGDLLCVHGKEAGRGHGTEMMLDLA